MRVRRPGATASAAERAAEIDDRHHGAAQVDHALDQRRRIRQRRHGLPAHDLAHLRDVDRIGVPSDLEAAEGHVILGRSLRL